MINVIVSQSKCYASDKHYAVVTSSKSNFQNLCIFIVDEEQYTKIASTQMRELSTQMMMDY